MAAYRMSRWPPQTQIAHEIDSVQAKMCAIILGLRPFPFEDLPAFFRRRARAARAECRKQGLWSEMWFKRATSWDEHLSRHPDIIATMFRDFRDSGWLQMQRANFANKWSCRSRSWTVLAGRTGTRTAPGYVAQRWQSGIELARARSCVQACCAGLVMSVGWISPA